ncbi:recombinase family protein [Hyphobacterium sp.]|uniref:recombinase family protein n=1 Tax=Hyphobacterium sp. TaxID=2004662 RepID=UPI003748E06F
MREKRLIRCAVYTRKSSEEGLDQDFNSLDAQYEACCAYIASQRGEGWKLVNSRYDDGGISGGTLERPGLQRLMDDVDAGRVDMIVVYKIDRLTRSLSDFARLVDRLDARNCSFVSVTQAFNTSTSMGRLTLNVLLSFAQFEREVTGERIRDKIAASKKKGMWMGGRVPIGYRSEGRSLILHEEEARIIRLIYELYRKHDCLREVELELRSDDICTPTRTYSNGRVTGGTWFSRGQIHRILTSPLYAGRIAHKDEVFEGLHEAIIPDDDWADMQARLEANAGGRLRRQPGDTKRTPIRHASPLAGRLFDETGDRLTPSHANARGKRLRYYVSRRLITKMGDTSPQSPGWRLPALPLEKAVGRAIANHLEHLQRSHRLLTTPDVAQLRAIGSRLTPLIARLEAGKADTLRALVGRIDIETGLFRGHIPIKALSDALSVEPSRIDANSLTFTAPFTIKRRGIEAKIVCGTTSANVDEVFVRGLAQSHHYLKRVRDGELVSSIARSNGGTQPPIRHRLKVAFISPRIVEAVLEGRQPADLTLERLLRTPIPHDWADQERLFGLKTPS